MMGFLPDEQGYLFLEDIAQHSHFREVLKVNTDDLKRYCEKATVLRYSLNIT